MLYLPVLFGVGFQLVHPCYTLLTQKDLWPFSTIPLLTWMSEYDMKQNHFQNYSF